MIFLKILLVLILLGLLRKLIWCLRWLWCRHRGTEPPAEPHGMPHQSGRIFEAHFREADAPTPDVPQPFGYKAAWLAARCRDPRALATALGSQDYWSASWESGLAAVENGGVFVSPQLGDFALAVGVTDPATELLENLAAQFPEVQYFASCRTLDYVGWLKYADGVLVRRYCYSGEAGEVLWEDGPLTPEELALGFDRFPRKGGPETGVFPDEEDVLHIAAAWGVDPAFEEKTFPPDTGWILK